MKWFIFHSSNLYNQNPRIVLGHIILTPDYYFAKTKIHLKLKVRMNKPKPGAIWTAIMKSILWLLIIDMNEEVMEALQSGEIDPNMELTAVSIIA